MTISTQKATKITLAMLIIGIFIGAGISCASKPNANINKLNWKIEYLESQLAESQNELVSTAADLAYHVQRFEEGTLDGNLIEIVYYRTDMDGNIEDDNGPEYITRGYPQRIEDSDTWTMAINHIPASIAEHSIRAETEYLDYVSDTFGELEESPPDS